MSGAAQRRLDGLRRLLEHLQRELGLPLGFVLWDGSRVPAGLPDGALAIAIADEGAIAGLIRSPRAETLAHLWVARRLDVLNGTLLDLANIPRSKRTKELRKRIDKRLALRALLPFLFVSRGGPWPLSAQPEDRRNRGDAEESRRNLSYHYDISNAFYGLWLDRDMLYTCGYCTDWNDDIDKMQQNKLEMICRKLRLKPGDRLLDLGCGWGALSVYAARHYGAEAYGVTLSQEQFNYCQEKIAKLGLQNRVTIELKDYALIEVDHSFDKIASVGFHEHIGADNYARYYETVKRLLKPDGLFLQQAITRPGKQKRPGFRRRPSAGKLFNKYIFPGGDLDHIGNTIAMMERHGFEVHDVENWREHYTRTCRQWHDRLLANYEAGVAEAGALKARMWLTYLAVCTLMFERNVFNLHQTLASRRRRGSTGLPPTRADLYR
jgi:cyclopropane-fatty-acyl-phospholipid synthase